MYQFEIANCPDTDSSLTNKAIINFREQIFHDRVEHIAFYQQTPEGKKRFVFTLAPHNTLEPKKIGFNSCSRVWGQLITGKPLQFEPYRFDPATQFLNAISFYARFQTQRATNSAETLDTEDMSRQFSMSFVNQAFSLGQIFGFLYTVKNKKILLELRVKELEAVQFKGVRATGNQQDTGDVATSKVECGITTPNTIIMFEKAEGCDINLIGGLTGKVAAPQILNPNWDFESMGIGGLSNEFSSIFRRCFASRILPAAVAAKFNVKHVKGMLLYGPPGTGKTLLARQIGKMLNAREPKVVNGPEILDKYVGESEKNIRLLFAEAEEEQKKSGVNSGLHMIIFDEIDAICKARSATSSSAGANDTVVNQLLTKIDGVDALNNVLLIGMTNRRDLIDEALLRPGRMEVQIEIGLPDEPGRLEIFKIHTRSMRENSLMAKDVNLEELASISKNFSGAEIQGLVSAAQSVAFNRVVRADGKVHLDVDLLNTINVTKADFLAALEKDVKPALGASEDTLKMYADPVIVWDTKIQTILDECYQCLLEASRQDPDATKGRKISVLIVGEPSCGQTALAANLALRTKFPFVRIYKPKDTVAMMESSKSQYMSKLFNDAYRSQLSCVLIDRLENIMEYAPIGPRFSNHVLQSFIANTVDPPPKGRNLLLICTCSSKQFLEDLGLSHYFDNILNVPPVTNSDQVEIVLNQLAQEGDMTFSDAQRIELVNSLKGMRFRFGIKKLINLATTKAAEDEPKSRVKKKFLARMQERNYIDHLASAGMMGQF